MQIENDTIYVDFHHAELGLLPQKEIKGFQIAGNDSVFVPAQAEYNYHKSGKNGVNVFLSTVKSPVAVRYCFDYYAEGNLKNMAGLPVMPFRTYNWLYKQK